MMESSRIIYANGIDYIIVNSISDIDEESVFRFPQLLQDRTIRGIFKEVKFTTNRGEVVATRFRKVGE